MRARIIVLADAGIGVHETARELAIARATVQRWRARWSASAGQPFAERLADAPRPGTPPRFEPEQICAIIALACESPSDSGRLFTHWTQATLAAAAAESGIVESISAHSVGRFLREVDLKPHRTHFINIILQNALTPRSELYKPRKCMRIPDAYELPFVNPHTFHCLSSTCARAGDFRCAHGSETLYTVADAALGRSRVLHAKPLVPDFRAPCRWPSTTR